MREGKLERDWREGIKKGEEEPALANEKKSFPRHWGKYFVPH